MGGQGLGPSAFQGSKPFERSTEPYQCGAHHTVRITLAREAKRASPHRRELQRCAQRASSIGRGRLSGGRANPPPRAPAPLRAYSASKTATCWGNPVSVKTRDSAKPCPGKGSISAGIANQKSVLELIQPPAIDVGQEVVGHVFVVVDAPPAGNRPREPAHDLRASRFGSAAMNLGHAGMLETGLVQVMGVQRFVDDRGVRPIAPGPQAARSIRSAAPTTWRFGRSSRPRLQGFPCDARRARYATVLGRTRQARRRTAT